MKPKKITKLTSLTFAAAIGLIAGLSGCYTILMNPGTQSTPQPVAQVAAGNESEIAYTDNCLSCHSQTELDDRYSDVRLVGMKTVHGFRIDPYGWSSPRESLPWWTPSRAPVYIAPATAIKSTPGTQAPAGQSADDNSRRRASGSSRGTDAPRGYEAPAAAPSTTTVPAPTGVSTGGPASSVAPSSAPDQGRATENPPSGSRTRKSGSTRGDEK
jgi:hypothetical protein